MPTKKVKKQEGGRPANWKEICMERVPPWTPRPKESPKVPKE